MSSIATCSNAIGDEDDEGEEKGEEEDADDNKESDGSAGGSMMCAYPGAITAFISFSACLNFV